jgi:tetratricopeptide (TPR) repeat protein
MVNTIGSKKRLYILFFVLFLIGKGYSQSDVLPVQTKIDSIITLKEAKEISYQAQATVEGLQTLLNYISFNDNAPSELVDVIANSYKPSRNRIFYDNKIIVEDDINPKSELGSLKDAMIENYLNDFDLQYEKAADASVSFSNITVSNIKKKDYIFVKVKFDAAFGNKYKPDGSSYTPRQREALVRVDKVGNNQWEALIMSISFYNPANSIDGIENNMQINTDTAVDALIVSQSEFEKEKQDFIKQRQEEEKKKKAVFDEYLEMGISYLNNKQYKEALEVYEKAKEIFSMVPVLDKRIIDVKKLISENTFENYKNKGDKAKGERRFNDAVLLYKQAIVLKPEAADILQFDISLLTQKLALFAFPTNKLQSGDYDGAIDECERVLREHKKVKNEYPELYLIMGDAYKVKGEKTKDKGSFKDALENYSTALQYFPNYKDARLARAKLNIDKMNDLVSAITDYDVLATNEFDDSADKPMFFVAKAKLKDRLSNTQGAISDYEKAISLAPNNPNIYFDFAEYYYRLNNYPFAKKNLDAAIKLNPNFNQALYYRGLANVGLNNSHDAGIDFLKAESMTLNKDQIERIESISNDFLTQANTLFGNHDFDNAELFYDKSLEIRKCNANALHGKAEIRLVKGNEFMPRISEKINSFYKESIDFNNQAITCDSKFSDAYFKKGIAHSKLLEYDIAATSFSNAIQNQADNIQAYFHRGEVYMIQKKYKDASDNYQQLITLLQKNIEEVKKQNDKDLLKNNIEDLTNSYNYCGQAQYFLGDYPNATLNLDISIDRNKTNHDAIYYRGLVDFAQNNYSESVKRFQKANKINSQLKYSYACAKAQFKNKNYSETISDLIIVISSDSTNTFVDKHFLRGLSYYKNKQYTEALNDFDNYNKIEISKTDFEFHAYYGFCQLHLNQDTPAEDHFNFALNLSSTNGWTFFGLACLNAKMGLYDIALDLVEKSFATQSFSKEDIKSEESTFFVEFNKVKENKKKYNLIKTKYLN